MSRGRTSLWWLCICSRKGDKTHATTDHSPKVATLDLKRLDQDMGYQKEKKTDLARAPFLHDKGVKGVEVNGSIVDLKVGRINLDPLLLTKGFPGVVESVFIEWRGKGKGERGGNLRRGLLIRKRG